MTDPLPPDLEAELEQLLEQPSDDALAGFEHLITRWPAHAAALRELWAAAWPALQSVAPADRPDTLQRLLQELAPAAAAPSPKAIGPYTVLRSLGSGAMGEVYLAEREVPVRLRVALKVVKRGLDTDEVLARFAQERQSLARMSHDAIARVYDAGATEQGQPYFAMELVEGLPISEYCDRHRIGIRARIELFGQVCAGVQHAHQKGLIHRDLKPSNVLVAHRDGVHVPKIIDFGLARATERSFDERSLLSEHGQLIGTPEYMSPEQARGATDEIDTRTDVYSLGVMLYELFTGGLPFRSGELPRGDLHEIRRRITEDEPPKPSTRISTFDAASCAERAEARALSEGGLRKALRGDLDWIVMRALSKEPERRYDTPNALAADLRRYLDHEPVEAGPPSAGYRLRKLFRRYRLQAVAGLVVFVAVLTGFAVSTALWLAVGKARDAEAAERRRAENLAAAESVARERAQQLGASESAARARAQATLTRFNQLANVVRLDRLRADETALEPAAPERLAAFESWLANAEALLAERETLVEARGALRCDARVPTAAEREADRCAHPQYSELLALEQQLAQARAALGEPTTREPFELEEAARAMTSVELDRLAWPRVAHPAARQVWGEEARGLALAVLAVEKSGGGDPSSSDTLAWARYFCGQPESARAASERAIELAPEHRKPDYRRHREWLETAIRDGAATLLRPLEDTVAELGAAVAARRRWEFDSGELQFLHDTLDRLIAELDEIAIPKTGLVANVRERRQWAATVAARSVLRYRERWEQARAALRKADGVAASGLYDAMVELPRLPGFVPIGINPKTKLLELYHLRSAQDPDAPPPVHDPETGRIDVNDEMGMVFVLVPGGAFWMGAQKVDETGRNYDPLADPDEGPVHEVTLSRFLLSRYEMTQGQWRRLYDRQARSWPEGGAPSIYRVGGRYVGSPVPIGWSHPVENVSWTECTELLGAHGLLLPTEAQWERACRAGTATPWYAGSRPGDLEGHGNVLDRTGQNVLPRWGGEAFPFEDGFKGPSPVGCFPESNAFGLHDMHGNVWEWCRDGVPEYRADNWREGDGLRRGRSGSTRIRRGGSFSGAPHEARAANRYPVTMSSRGLVLGLRPVAMTR